MPRSSSLARPFEGNYGVSVTIALLALIPFIVVTTAYEFYRSHVLSALGGQGLLLVVALPPVIRQFPAEKLPYTAALIDLGFFGAIAVGPLVGALTASFGGRHPEQQTRRKAS